MANRDRSLLDRLPSSLFGLGFLDLLAALALVPFLLLDLTIASQGERGSLSVLVSVVAVAAVLVRRRWSLSGVLVVSSLSLALTAAARVSDRPLDPEVVVPLALAYLLIPVVRRRAAPIAVGASMVAVVAVTLESTLRDHRLGPPALLLVLVWSALGTGIGLGLYQRWVDTTRRQAVAAARQAERLDLARELHDVVAHHLTGIVVQAQAALLVAGDRADVTVGALRSIEAAGSDALDSMRALVGSLRHDERPVLLPVVSIDDIGALVDETRQAGHPVTLTLDLPPDAAVPDAVSGAAYRIVQESLANVRRHAAPATSVEVRVAGGAGAVEVTIADGGPNHQPRVDGGGFGIVGMRERVSALGGTFEAGPVRGQQGWRVRARLPLGST